MLPTNSTFSHAHNDATKTQCAICVTEIGNQSSNNSRQMYKLCTKYLHSGIAKEFPDDCELGRTSSDKDQIPLCGKCLGSAKELEEVTQTLASLRKCVSDMVLIFSLDILHRRGKNTLNQESGTKLIQLDVSKLPDNDSWSSTMFTTATDEIVSTEIQENIDRGRCMGDKGDNVETGAHDEVIFEDVDIELMIAGDQVSGSIEVPLRNVPCSSAACILPSVAVQENATETFTTEIGVPVDISELDSIGSVIKRTTTLENNLNANAASDSYDFEIAAADFVRGESTVLTANSDQRQITTAEKNDNNVQNRISMPIVKLQRLRFQWKSNPNGQGIVVVNDGRKSNTIPKFELILKREPEVSTDNIPEVLHKVQNISVPSTSTSTSVLSLPMLSTNSKAGHNSVARLIPKRKTTLKKNVELVGGSDQKDSYQNQKSSAKHSEDSDRRNSKKGGFPCTVCKKIFLQMSHLLLHRRHHQKTRSYKCSLCLQRFPKKNKLKIHQRVKHGGKIDKCLFCDKEFANSRDLNIHRRTHTGEKPFKCTLCEKSYSSNGVLANHMRLHTDEKPYKCTFCDKEFVYSNTLNVHRRTHTGEKPYKCPFCKMAFSHGSSLNRHTRIHTGEKPFKCDKCDFSCAHANTLISHKIRRHSNNRSLKCRDCQKTFKMRGDIRQHYKQAHANIEFTDKCILPNN